MQPKSYFVDWFDTGISFKDLELVYQQPFKMTRQQTYRGQVLMLNGWEVHSYVIILSLLCLVANNDSWG